MLGGGGIGPIRMFLWQGVRGLLLYCADIEHCCRCSAVESLYDAVYGDYYVAWGCDTSIEASSVWVPFAEEIACLGVLKLSNEVAGLEAVF